MTSSKTQELTFGAMIVAIFGVLLLLNRQTGDLFVDFFMFIFPIPMVAFSAKYGWKDSLPVFFCTILISILCGTFTAIFYAISESFIGTVYGARIHAKKDMNRTMILVMALSAVAELLSNVALASFSGIDLNASITEMQTTMNQAFEQAGVSTASGILSYDYLRRMYVISMAFLGVIEGFIVYELSILILRKLKFRIQKPQPLSRYYPWKGSGLIALCLLFLYVYTYSRPFENELLQNFAQTAGICGYLYLLCFGFIAGTQICRYYLRMPRWLGLILSLVCMFTLVYLVMIIGYLYITGSLHDKLNRKAEETAGQKHPKVR